ncbi:TlpA family protein disulfide reductase [Ghiorsea bivora]|uniref:TlpA family protein disulfide reductase n=1 Tax=Ghiorsea bivora TaxID=1485545 RepID=UPI0005706873|nr:TlpA disulfide reductase family protein [Ghiorsea bivora]
MKYIWIILMMLLVAPVAAQSVEYQWRNVQGETVQLDSYKGKPVILHFWASWCPPCRSEMPEMNNWVQQHPDVKVVMISLDADQAGAAAFYAQKNIQQPLNMGNQRDTMALGVRGLPTTLVIDADGNIKERHMGDLNWADERVSLMVLDWLR